MVLKGGFAMRKLIKCKSKIPNTIQAFSYSCTCYCSCRCSCAGKRVTHSISNIQEDYDAIHQNGTGI
jgi:putative bacteriocin precursor